MKPETTAMQYSLGVEGAPLSVVSLKVRGSQLLVNRLTNDKMWPGQNRGMGIITDWDTLEEFPYDLKFMTVGQAPKSGRFTVHVASSKPLTFDNPDLERNLKESIAKLSRYGVFYLIEEKGNDLQSDWRIDKMGQFGLVEKSVLRSNPDFIIWRGRSQKEHQRVGVDILTLWKNSHEPWKREFFHNQAVEVVKRLKKLGYRVVNWDEITAELHATKNIPESISRLKNGHGITVESTCGCKFQIDLNGNSSKVFRCGTPDCDGIPPQSEDQIRGGSGPNNVKPERIYHLSIYTRIEGNWCGDCMTAVDERVEVLKDFGNGKSLIKIEHICPACGGKISSGKSTVNNRQLVS